MRIVKGDKVVVLSGNSKGQTGEVLKILTPKRAGRVIVKGLNMVKRHSQADPEESPGRDCRERGSAIHMPAT